MRSAIPPRASRTQGYPVQTNDIDDVPDSYFDTRIPTSAIRYRDTRGNRIIQRGNKRIVFHEEPLPKKHGHRMLYLGIGMVASLALYVGFQMLGNWWTEHQYD